MSQRQSDLLGLLLYTANVVRETSLWALLTSYNLLSGTMSGKSKKKRNPNPKRISPSGGAKDDSEEFSSPGCEMCTVNDEKIKNLEISLKSTYTFRKKYETLANRLLINVDENERELAELQTKLKNEKYSRMVLQKRLEENKINSDVEHTGWVLPGTNEKLVKDLVQSNRILQQQLDYKERDPKKMQELSERNIELMTKYNGYSEQIGKLEEENESLRRIINGSRDEKDMEIKRLQNQVQKAETKAELYEIAVIALQDEKEKALEQGRNKDELLKKYLQRLKNPSKTDDDDADCCSMASVQTEPPSPRFRKPDVKEKVAQSEIVRLRDKLKAVEDMNKKWQAYNNKQQENMNKLKEELKKYESLMPSKEGSSEDEKKQFETQLLSNKQEMYRLEEEIGQFRARYKSLDSKYRDTCRENAHLRRNLQDYEQRESRRKNPPTLQQNPFFPVGCNLPTPAFSPQGQIPVLARSPSSQPTTSGSQSAEASPFLAGMAGGFVRCEVCKGIFSAATYSQHKDSCKE